MSDNSNDAGIISVLMERFEHQRLPRTMKLKEKVDRGEPLDEFDIAFLDEVFADSDQVKQIIDRHPEFHHLYKKVTNLYKEITSKALENEKL